MALGPGAIRRAWYQWRMMRFPWRKKWLVGFDLHGNTFWEFKDALHAMRNRRIAKYSRSTHFGDVNVSPSWMQWLRHTRFDPPSLAEQQQDIMRQDRMKVLASQADARWASKPSALDAPDKQQPVQMLQSRDPDSGVVQTNVEQERREQGEARVPVQQEEEIGSQGVQAQTGAQQMPRDPPEPASEELSEVKTRKRMKKEPKDSPWKSTHASSGGEEWQPKGWSPGAARKR